MEDLSSRAKNNLIIGLGIACVILASCAVSGWIVAFAANYSLSVGPEDLEAYSGDGYEPGDVGVDTGYDDYSDDTDELWDSYVTEEADYNYEQICGLQRDGRTYFEDADLSIWFSLQSEQECAYVFTYKQSGSQYINIEGEGSFISVSTSVSGEDFAIWEGEEVLEATQIQTADGIGIEVAIYRTPIEDYDYYMVTAKPTTEFGDIHFQALMNVSRLEDTERAYELMIDFVETIEFNFARG